MGIKAIAGNSFRRGGNDFGRCSREPLIKSAPVLWLLLIVILFLILIPVFRGRITIKSMSKIKSALREIKSAVP